MRALLACGKQRPNPPGGPVECRSHTPTLIRSRTRWCPADEIPERITAPRRDPLKDPVADTDAQASHKRARPFRPDTVNELLAGNVRAAPTDLLRCRVSMKGTGDPAGCAHRRNRSVAVVFGLTPAPTHRQPDNMMIAPTACTRCAPTTATQALEDRSLLPGRPGFNL